MAEQHQLGQKAPAPGDDIDMDKDDDHLQVMGDKAKRPKVGVLTE